MSDLDSMDRENKKRQLRRQIVSFPAPQEEDSEEIVRKARKRVKIKRLRIFLIFAVILIGAGAGLSRYFWHHQYAGYDVVWEKELKEGSFTGYMDFGSSVLRYSKDGASCIDNQGKEVWAQSYEMNSPIASVMGDYAAIADQQGNHIYIFDKAGLTGTATTLLPVIKSVVSAHGVVAAILEDSTSNYIYFYKSDGSALDVKIMALLNGDSGYPVDISLSPDGTQLIEAYAYLKNSALNGRVVFHNFDVGKSKPDRLVGGFDEPFDSSLVARVHFLNDTHSCAFADNSVSFYSTVNALSPELLKLVSVDQEIRSVFYSDKYVGIIVNNTEGENPQQMNVYRPDGSLVFSKPFQYSYANADIDGAHVFLYNENSCRVYNMSGRLVFEGTLDFPISKIRNGRHPNTLLAMGSQSMKEIKLK